MFKPFLIFTAFITLIAIAPWGQTQAANQEGIHILELFTSQSCSSCPSADEFLEELDKRDDVITLSCNVTYWNHLHWEDTLSQDFCTQKQRQYSYTQNKGGRIFTPELMIDGTQSFVGSQRRKIEHYLSNNASTAIALNLRHHDNQISIAPLKAGKRLAQDNVVTLISYGDKYTQFVPSGENRGRTIHYSNPILNMNIISKNWDGTTPLTVDIKKTSAGRPSGYVILLSNKTATGKILAAGKIAL